MKQALALAVMMSFLVVFGVLWKAKVSAAQAAGLHVVDLPGVGPVDLNQLPPDLAKNIRIPGEAYPETKEEYRNLPKRSMRDEDAVRENMGQLPNETPKAAHPEIMGNLPPWQKHVPREKVLERMYRERAFPGDRIPEGAYHRALEQMRQMPAAEPPASTPRQASQSWLLGPLRWLAQLWTGLSPSRAFAQIAQWTFIGPAPATLEDGATRVAGVINSITVDPQDSQRIYLATPNGGLWRTTDGGSSWVTTTDNQPSLRIETIAVDPHPNYSNVVMAGTGSAMVNKTIVQNGVGVLRSTDSGSTWCQAGPSWPVGTAYKDSDAGVGQLVFDGTQAQPRLWAATSRGLWYSDNAWDTNVTCSQVTWTRVTSLPNRQDGDTPEQVSHIFLSPWNDQVLYASIVQSDANNSGWWKSTDGGTTWSRSRALSSPKDVTRAAITKGTAGVDILYSLVTNTGVTCKDLPASKTALEQTTDSGATWQYVLGPYNPNSGPLCEGLRSVRVDPTDSTLVALGATQLWRSTDGGSTFSTVGSGVLHLDHNGLTFVGHDVLLDGNDGGIWRTASFSTATNTSGWTNLNGNLGNFEFHAGTIDNLNYGSSWGGAQDNYTIRGGTGSVWSDLRYLPLRTGDDSMVIVDPKDSNTVYVTDIFGSGIARTVDGGGSFASVVNNLPRDSKGSPEISDHSLAMDPSDSSVLVAYSKVDGRMYRTTNADDSNASRVNWQSITTNAECAPPTATTSPTPAPTPCLPAVSSVAIAPSQAPPSDLIFAATCGDQLWRTTGSGSWVHQGGTQLPSRCLPSIAIDPSSPCNANSCTLYVVASGFNVPPDGPPDPIPGHVFRSSDAGMTWENISYSVDVPADKVLVHPSDPNVIYVATDLGILQGTFDGTSWSWGTFVSGFPQAALVKDLSLDANAGLLRAWTFGRGVWESQPFPIPNPELKVNTTNGQGGALPPHVSSGNTGQYYALAWGDDRMGANNFHAYYRGYTYDADGHPESLGYETQVDDTSDHVVQNVALSAHPTQTEPPYCSKVVWSDDRLNPGVNWHIFFQHVCSDGYHLYTDDVQADDNPADLNATNPSVAYRQDITYAVAWQSDHSAGSSYRDVYARYFNAWGGYLTDQFKVNNDAEDATSPAVATDASGNVFVAWQEFDSASQNGQILISKYDYSGNLIAGPTRVDDNQPAPIQRLEPALAVDDSGNVTVTWWEADGFNPESTFVHRLSNSLVSLSDEMQVNQRPLSVGTGHRTGRPKIATDSSGDFAIAWQSNLNDPDSITAWNGFARTFDSSGSTLKNDFRLDLAPRTAYVSRLSVARSSQTGDFVYTWRDDRSGANDVYTRVVPSLN